MSSPRRSLRLRLCAALLGFAALAAACSSEDPSTVASDDGPLASGDAGASVPATDGSGGGADEPPSTAADGAGSSDQPVQTAPPDTAAESTTTTAPVPAPGPVGGYARLYLSPASSATTAIEVFVQEGAAPGRATLEHLQAVLGEVSGKQISVTTASLGGGAKAWTADELRALGDANGSAQTRERSAIKLFYLRGSFAASDSAVGVAVRSDVAAVFADKVDETAGVLGNRAAIEDAVSMHELGHLLGLVDLVLSTGRQDPEHPGHSTNRDSVMYYAVESTLLGSILEGGPPRDFDQADLADLAAIRNG